MLSGAKPHFGLGRNKVSAGTVSPTVCGLRSCDERDGALTIDSTSAEARNAERPTPSGRAHPITRRRIPSLSVASESPPWPASPLLAGRFCFRGCVSSEKRKSVQRPTGQAWGAIEQKYEDCPSRTIHKVTQDDRAMRSMTSRSTRASVQGRRSEEMGLVNWQARWQIDENLPSNVLGWLVENAINKLLQYLSN